MLRNVSAYVGRFEGFTHTTQCQAQPNFHATPYISVYSGPVIQRIFIPRVTSENIRNFYYMTLYEESKLGSV